jgi:hypothetical protein
MRYRCPFDIKKRIEYIHRWTGIYRISVLAKFYQLENWLKENPAAVTMLTHATYQHGQYSATVKGDIVTIPQILWNTQNLMKTLAYGSAAIPTE